VYTLAIQAASDVVASQPSITKVLRDIDGEICRSFKVTCHRAKPKATKARRSAKASATSPKISKQRSADRLKEVVAKKAQIRLGGQLKTPPFPKRKPLLQATRASFVILPNPKPSKWSSKRLDEESIPGGSSADCLRQLRAQGAEFTVNALADKVATGVVGNGVCHVQGPVRLEYVRARGHLIRLPEEPLLNCKYALQFSKWLADTAAPISAANSNSSLEKVSTGPGYECRGRNGDTFAKISEHGKGNAVDISTFSMLDGTVIRVADAQNPNSPSREVLRKLRTSACGYFTTVLGPGSNAAHASHFHFDLGTHGKSGTYRICE
jgi:hypothetical protein